MSIQISVDQHDIASIQKRIYQISGTPLAKRLQQAIKEGLTMLVGPIQAAAPFKTGRLRASVRGRAPRKRAGEVAAYQVGPTATHAHLVIQGHRVVTHYPTHRDTGKRARANPFVENAARPFEGAVESYIGERVTAL